LRQREVTADALAKLTASLEAAGLEFAGDSVTAQEMHHAAFSSARKRFRRFFYLRTPPVHSNSSFPRELVPVFEENSGATRSRLARLKQRIFEEAPGIVREYHAEYRGIYLDSAFVPASLSRAERAAVSDLVITPEEWSKAGSALRRACSRYGTVALSGVDHFGEQVLEDLWTQIEQDLATASEEAAPMASADAQFHERFARERAHGFLGRGELVRHVLGKLTDAGASELIIVHGLQGSGKSALLAEVVRRLRSDPDGPRIVPYFVGAAPGPTELAVLLRHLIQHLDTEGIDPGRIPRELDELTVRWIDYLQKAAHAHRTVLVVDGVNQIHSYGRAWLPPRTPPGATLIVSTTDPEALPLSAAERAAV
jgi:hypothetical protein